MFINTDADRIRAHYKRSHVAQGYRCAYCACIYNVYEEAVMHSCSKHPNAKVDIVDLVSLSTISENMNLDKKTHHVCRRCDFSSPDIEMTKKHIKKNASNAFSENSQKKTLWPG